ncbi:hypothetical protein GCK72_011836 [Caenorhabditis remanei]|uniref:Uncharacterized protein n=1 Tax=Caenorhabditis remanei TaxID=31234 RepID=A0A6A5H6W0_CAERE|nr:hypothetical protein GCK72_011836 [Caenorhabditis remanei]KAF1763570.1 hypothetical protein GCK72_011836 [Caenorhabditis remanei]
MNQLNLLLVFCLLALTALPAFSQSDRPGMALDTMGAFEDDAAGANEDSPRFKRWGGWGGRGYGGGYGRGGYGGYGRGGYGGWGRGGYGGGFGRGYGGWGK